MPVTNRRDVPEPIGTMSPCVFCCPIATGVVKSTDVPSASRACMRVSSTATTSVIPSPSTSVSRGKRTPCQRKTCSGGCVMVASAVASRMSPPRESSTTTSSAARPKDAATGTGPSP